MNLKFLNCMTVHYLIFFLFLSTMNYLAEALTDLDEGHDKSGSTTVDSENDMYYRLAQDETHQF